MTVNANPLAPRRIVVVGNAGSGKTTLARRAAAIIGGRHIELDALYHEPGWVTAEPKVFRARVRAAIDGHPRWVTDGGYRSYVWDITWTAADEIVWLDLPVSQTYSRLVRRQLSRRMRNEVLWNGNRESLGAMLFSRDSLLWFAIKHRNKYRKAYPEAFKAPHLARVRVSRLRKQCEVDAWLLALTAAAAKTGAGASMTASSQQPTADSEQPAAPPRRIAVIGTSGTGKTTFSRRVAQAIGAPHVELDALFHGPNWTPAAPDVFRARVSEAIAGPAWVTDGNYSRFLRDLIWPAADVLVWLDYPFRIVIWRLFLRTMRRRIKREVLWNGNRESLRSHFFTRDSLFLWAQKTHWKHRREWPATFASPAMAHVRIVRLQRPREPESWLAALQVDKPTS